MPLVRPSIAACWIVAVHLVACGDRTDRQRTGQNVEVPNDDSLVNSSTNSGDSTTSEAPGVSTSESDGVSSASGTVQIPVDPDCYVPEARPVPTRSDCAVTVLACQPGSDGCLSTSLAVSIKARIFDACEIYCGELEIGTSQGCITLVEDRIGNASDFECVKQQLLGTRWECAPSDGVSRVFLESCTRL